MAADFRAPGAFRSVTAEHPADVAKQAPTGARPSAELLRAVSLEFVAVAATALAASAWYTYSLSGTWHHLERYTPAAILIGILVILNSLALRQYTAITHQPRHRFLWNGLAAVTIAFSFFLSIIFLLKFAEDYSRATFFIQFVGVSIAVLGARAYSYSRIQSKIAAGAVEAERIVVIGDVPGGSAAVNDLARFRSEAVGIFPFPVHRELFGQTAQDLGPDEIAKLISSCRSLRPDNIVILARLQDLPHVADLANALSEIPVSIHMIPLGIENLLGSSTISEVGGLATVQLLHPPLSMFDRFVKGAFDRVSAALGLIVLAPLLVVTAIAIKLDSRGPILFRQTRHGFNNGVIRVFKFRTMNVIEAGSNFTPATKADPRVTRVGRVLRRSNIDELPQLINVLLGQMSIVGPRPHATAQNELFDKLLSGFSRRHAVKPGITGWAQINGYRGETDTVDKMKRRVEYDLFYIDNWSFLFDLKIILLTLLSRRAYLNAY
jgi:Undecaprenyl-phosphate glucose phosphotransferase